MRFLLASTLAVMLAAFYLSLSAAPDPHTPDAQKGVDEITLHARTSDSLFGKGITVIGPDALEDFQLSASRNELGRHEIVTVEEPLPEGASFRQALRLTTLKVGENLWDPQATLMRPLQVETGDVYFVEFWIRSPSTGRESPEAYIEFVFEENAPPWNKAAQRQIAATQEWTRFTLPFTVTTATKEAGWGIRLRMGFTPQTIEIAGLRLLNLGPSAKLKDFPTAYVTYPGRDADATWRTAALKRIDEHRRSELRIHVVGSDGRPVSDVPIEARMVRHHFTWGTAVEAKRLAGYGTDALRYRKEVPHWFNEIVFENHLKWRVWEESIRGSDRWNQTWVNEALQWARGHQLSVRGHNLVWASWQYLPDWLSGLQDDPTKLREAIRAHVLHKAGHYSGQLTDWDVINEPNSERDLTDIFGRDIMVEVFNWTRDADPHARLYLNEYGIISEGGAARGLQDAFFENITYLLRNGAPLGGIGMQSHLSNMLTPPERIIDILERFSTFELPIKITELSMEQPSDPDLAYDFMRDYLIAVYSVPAVKGVLMWGFWDGSPGVKSPLFGVNWELKSSGKAYRDLVKGEWWTRVRGQTDSDGSFVFRGTQGVYELTVAGTKRREVSLPENGDRITVLLE